LIRHSSFGFRHSGGHHGAARDSLHHIPVGLRGSRRRSARCAKQAGVKQLILIHLSAKQKDASLAAAQKIFANTAVAVEGQTLVFPRRSPNDAAPPR
jgi:hypothetical protein